jgi:hypothetical protein
MWRVELHDALRMTVGATGLSPEDAADVLHKAMVQGLPRRLRVWCNGRLLSLHEFDTLALRINFETHRFEAWPKGPAWDGTWSDYRFEVDGAELKMLLAVLSEPPHREEVKRAIKQKALDLQRAGQEVDAGILRRWAEQAYGKFPAVVPSRKSISTWLYKEWGFHPPTRGRCTR